MKLAIRQRCGSGCVVCGRPIFEYDHIFGYDDDKGHVESEITLLCDGCHRKKTGGLLSIDRVIRGNENPHNKIRGWSTPDQFWYAAADVDVVLGTNRFQVPKGISTQPQGNRDRYSFSPLAIDGRSIVRIDKVEGLWNLSLLLMDKANRVLLEIDKNEITYNVNRYDINFEGKTLTIRNGPKDILFRASFASPECVIMNADFWYNGCNLKIDRKSLLLPGRLRLTGLCFRSTRAHESGVHVLWDQWGTVPLPPPLVYIVQRSREMISEGGVYQVISPMTGEAAKQCAPLYVGKSVYDKSTTSMRPPPGKRIIHLVGETDPAKGRWSPLAPAGPFPCLIRDADWD
jgi:trigger factor